MSAPSGKSGFDFGDLSKRERASLATQLFGGTPASGLAKGVAGLLGASDFTGALAGDAFMPGALGADGTSSPSFGARLGGKLRDPKLAQNLLFAGARGALSMQQAREAQQAEQRANMASGLSGIRANMAANMANVGGPTSTYWKPPAAQAQMDPRDPRYQQWMAMQIGGFG